MRVVRGRLYVDAAAQSLSAVSLRHSEEMLDCCGSHALTRGSRVFIDIDAIVAEIAGCTMLDDIAQRLGQPVKTVMGLDCVEVVTAAGTVMISNRYVNGNREIEIGYV